MLMLAILKASIFMVPMVDFFDLTVLFFEICMREGGFLSEFPIEARN